jgi:imidazolonepropionase-like amidohydrolase
MTHLHTRTILAACAIAAACVIAARADAPHVYAITGARIVPVSAPPIDSGTLVVRNGFVQAVGASVAPPADAVVIDGKGLTVYPGLIDMGHPAGLAVPAVETARDARTLMEAERARRQALIRPQVEAAGYVKADAPELKRLASAGITSVLATPAGDMIKGRSSLVAVAAPDDEPQIGNVADERRGLYVLRTPVALHVGLPSREGGGGYPASLMGAMAFLRQAFLDAGHYRDEIARYRRSKAAEPRPVYDAALEALEPALSRKLPVVFQAGTATEIRRVLAFAREFQLDAMVSGGVEADKVADELKARKTPVVFSLNYPTRPRALAPDADEPLATLRQRANAPKVPAALEKAGVALAFQSGGLADPRDFVKNAGRAVRAGLAPEAALKALTLNAATLAGMGDRLGSIDAGKIANLLVTDGDLFDEKTKVKHVFVDGRPVVLEEPAPAPRRRDQ